MTSDKTHRASHIDIFSHLDRLLGDDAETIVARTMQHVQAGDGDAALATLQAFDAIIGGMGLQAFKGRKLPGAYRAISYVAMDIRRPDPEEFSRRIIASSCEHVEAVLKRIVRLNPFESMRADFIPMGPLANKLRKHLPLALYADLKWLSQICNSAKHEHDFGDDPEPEPEHFFDLDEAIAIYLIARRIVVQLQEHFQKSNADLAGERARVKLIHLT